MEIPAAASVRHWLNPRGNLNGAWRVFPPRDLYRLILENKDNYGLKRWEIGEIASKIGQLYYHYYLRTSETNYLFESYIFYDAIRERSYFKDVLESKK